MDLAMNQRSTDQIWNHRLVGNRLIEAARTVERMPPAYKSPKEFGGIWPVFNAMTFAELTAFKNDLLATEGEGALKAWEREQNRTRTPPSGREIERADEALGWGPRYLGHDKDLAKIVGFWAYRTYNPEDEIPGPVRAGLRDIARGLRKDRVPVRLATL